MAAFWHHIKSLCAHTNLLILILLSAFLAFAFHPGSLIDIMRLGLIMYLIHLMVGNHHLRYLSRAHLVMFGVMLIILMLNLTVPLSQIHPSALANFIAVPGLVLVCHLLACKSTDRTTTLKKTIGLTAVGIAVVGQLIIMLLSTGANDGAYGNIHHLGLFASVCIPLAGYFALAFKRSARLIAILLVILALYLLWESGSRVSWLAFFLSILLTAVASPAKKQSFYILLSLAGIGVITAVISGFENIGVRLGEFLTTWRTEERVYIWRDTLELLNQNSVADWVRGRGIGSFRFFFKDYPGLSLQKLEALPTFPHNVGIQVLFENGIIGLILIFGALGAFVRKLWLGIRRSENSDFRYIYTACFIIFWVLFLHTLLTKSIYSKYITYLFSMVAGIALALDQKEGQAKMLTHLFPGIFSQPDPS